MPYALAYVYGSSHVKKRVKSGGGKGSGKLRDLYAVLFRAKGIMPDVLDRQDPTEILDLLDSLTENKQEEYAGNDPYLQMFYGQ